MSFDFIQRIIDMFGNMSNQVLRNILVISTSILLSVIIVVYSKGKDKGILDNKIETLEKNMVEIKNNQSKTYDEVLKNRQLFNNNIFDLYNELLKVQNLDKKIFDNKLNILVDYGIKNENDKKTINNIFNILDDKRESDIVRLHTENKHKKDTIIDNIDKINNLENILYKDNFELNMDNWIINNSNDPDSFITISEIFNGANNTKKSLLFNTGNPITIDYFTSSIEKTFSNVNNIRLNLWYYFEDYRGGEIIIYINDKKIYSIYTESKNDGDLLINRSNYNMWKELNLDLSEYTKIEGIYTIKIEGISKSSPTWKDRVAIDEIKFFTINL